MNSSHNNQPQPHSSTKNNPKFDEIIEKRKKNEMANLQKDLQKKEKIQQQQGRRDNGNLGGYEGLGNNSGPKSRGLLPDPTQNSNLSRGNSNTSSARDINNNPMISPSNPQPSNLGPAPGLNLQPSNSNNNPPQIPQPNQPIPVPQYNQNPMPNQNFQKINIPVNLTSGNFTINPNFNPGQNLQLNMLNNPGLTLQPSQFANPINLGGQMLGNFSNAGNPNFNADLAKSNPAAALVDEVDGLNLNDKLPSLEPENPVDASGQTTARTEKTTGYPENSVPENPQNLMPDSNAEPGPDSARQISAPETRTSVSVASNVETVTPATSVAPSSTGGNENAKKLSAKAPAFNPKASVFRPKGTRTTSISSQATGTPVTPSVLADEKEVSHEVPVQINLDPNPHSQPVAVNLQPSEPNQISQIQINRPNPVPQINLQPSHDHLLIQEQQRNRILENLQTLQQFQQINPNDPGLQVLHSQVKQLFATSQLQGTLNQRPPNMPGFAAMPENQFQTQLPMQQVVPPGMGSPPNVTSAAPISVQPQSNSRPPSVHQGAQMVQTSGLVSAGGVSQNNLPSGSSRPESTKSVLQPRSNLTTPAPMPNSNNLLTNAYPGLQNPGNPPFSQPPTVPVLTTEQNDSMNIPVTTLAMPQNLPGQVPNLPQLNQNVNNLQALQNLQNINAQPHNRMNLGGLINPAAATGLNPNFINPMQPNQAQQHQLVMQVLKQQQLQNQNFQNSLAGFSNNQQLQNTLGQVTLPGMNASGQLGQNPGLNNLQNVQSQLNSTNMLNNLQLGGLNPQLMQLQNQQLTYGQQHNLAQSLAQSSAEFINNPAQTHAPNFHGNNLGQNPGLQGLSGLGQNQNHLNLQQAIMQQHLQQQQASLGQNSGLGQNSLPGLNTGLNLNPTQHQQLLNSQLHQQNNQSGGHPEMMRVNSGLEGLNFRSTANLPNLNMGQNNQQPPNQMQQQPGQMNLPGMPNQGNLQPGQQHPHLNQNLNGLNMNNLQMNFGPR